MSHELEVIDGRATFLGWEDAWHRLGEIKGRALTRSDVEQYPHILSPVEMVPAYFMTPSGVVQGRTGGTMRTHDEKIVGEGLGYDTYGVVQPLDMYELGALTGLDLYSVGTIREGRQFFFTFTTNDPITVNGVELQRYFSILGSHDGSIANMGKSSTIATVCANTLEFNLKSKSVYTFRHTKNVQDRVDQALQALAMHRALDLDLRDTVERLQATEVTLGDFQRFLDDVAPASTETGRSATFANTKRESIATLYLRSEQVAPWKGTGWGLVQAANTYEQWVAPVRGGADKAQLRALRQFDALVKGQPLTTRALKAVLV